MAGKFRGQSVWDPVLIVYQIVTVQLLSYASLCLLIIIATGIADQTPSTTFIFDHRIIRIGTAKMTILAHIANALVGSYLLKVFIERTKLCLDFSLTYYAIHFLTVWYFSRSIPDTFIWYFINACGACLMCVGGELLCQKEEMKTIQL